MTTKAKTTELHDGEQWVDVSEHATAEPNAPLTAPAPGDTPAEVEPDDARPKPISLHDMTAEAALSLLKSLRVEGGPVVVDAPTGKPKDAVVLDSHAFAGEWRSRDVWWFHPASLEMAYRVAGWSKVECDGSAWRLS